MAILPSHDLVGEKTVTLALQIKQLSKRYGDRAVLEDLSLAIAPGDIYGLLGPNGAGKTTTINIICNLLRADSGTVKVNGKPVSDATKSWIGVAPQENLLYRSLTCRENLNFFAQIYGLSKRDRQRQVQMCLEAVNLVDRANSPVETLSGGMQRRLSMAIALVHRPKLVILDEPTTGLDIEARYEIWELIKRLKNQGITILLTTHLLEEAERLCQKIGILKGGQLLAEGTLADLRERIAAQEIVVVHTSDEPAAIARAREHGFKPRRYGGELAFWLPDPLELKDILHRFEGIPLDSISRQPVRLEHIYVEITQGAPTEFFVPEGVADPWE
ncbi:MAG: ABC transporter ATP-binding protein [Oculatellaceae cyanobacterium bins.114]|nr:ABC transporter ATP-binding protein [Oculatellaceae cyanobacterium bins.114]